MGTTARGQSGLDRLALFVLGVLLLLLVAPTVLGFAGVDIRAESPGDGTPAGAAQLIVLSAEGGAVDGAVGSVSIDVTVAGSGGVDADSLTVTWVGNGSYSLVAAGGGSGGADGEFGVRVHEDSDGRIGPGERATLTFDVGADDVDGIGEFGARLRPGERVVVTLTGEGTTVTRRLAVPEPLPNGTGVAL